MILGTRTNWDQPLHPAIRLAAGTVLDIMEDAHGPEVFSEISDIAITIAFLAEEATPAREPGRAGRISHRKAEGVITTEVILDPWSMIEEPVMEASPGSVSVSGDHLRVFADCLEAGFAALVGWCDRKGAWADRARFIGRRDAALEAMRQGRLARPGEFAATPEMRDALDATWALLAATALDREGHAETAGAYLALRDVGWQEAAYEPDPDAPLIDGGHQARLAAKPQNLASAPPPDHRAGYSIV